MTVSRIKKSNVLPGATDKETNRPCLAFPDLTAHIIFWAPAITGLILDLWTKKTVFDWLIFRENQSFSLIDGFLQFVRTTNDGAAWGVLAGRYYLLSIVSIAALVMILVIFSLSGRQPRLVHIALGFFAAGVSGNLYDRIFNDGSVRDFIDVYYRQYHWPAFNIADSLLCIGVGLLIVSSLFTGRPVRKRARQQK